MIIDIGRICHKQDRLAGGTETWNGYSGAADGGKRILGDDASTAFDESGRFYTAGPGYGKSQACWRSERWRKLVVGEGVVWQGY